MKLEIYFFCQKFSFFEITIVYNKEMQGTTIASIPSSTLPELQDIVNQHRGEQVASIRDEFVHIKDSLWSTVNGLMKDVVSIKIFFLLIF